MDNKEIAESLKRLARLDMDAAWMYDRALEKVDAEDARLELAEMRDQHLEHFENISNFIRQLGDRPPKKGYTHELSEGLAPITEDLSDEQMLLTLRENEKIIKARVQELTDEVQIPELSHDLEEDIEDEQVYIDILDDLTS